jgi:hypothetical protein
MERNRKYGAMILTSTSTFYFGTGGEVGIKSTQELFSLTPLFYLLESGRRGLGSVSDPPPTT